MSDPSSTVPQPSGPLPDSRRQLTRVTGLFLLLTVALSWPLPLQLTTHLLGTGTDPDLYMWTLGWNAHALLTQPISIFDANIFHPSRYSLAYSENLTGSSILMAPVIWLTQDLLRRVSAG